MGHVVQVLVEVLVYSFTATSRAGESVSVGLVTADSGQCVAIAAKRHSSLFSVYSHYVYNQERAYFWNMPFLQVVKLTEIICCYSLSHDSSPTDGTRKVDVHSAT